MLFRSVSFLSLIFRRPAERTGDRVADDVLEEDLEDATGLLVDEARDTLDSSTASETADRGLGDSLDVVTKNLAVTLGSSLAESLSALSLCG